MRVWAIYAVLILACAACDGSNDGDNGNENGVDPAEPTSVTAEFDPNILTALVLGPQDVPPLPQATGNFNPQRDAGISFATVYEGAGIYIQSQVGYIDDPVDRADGFKRIREGIAAIVKGERNYDRLTGADLAFAYKSADPPTISTLAFKGEYFINVAILSSDGSRPDLVDEATLDRYTDIVWGRLMQYLQDPTSVTPIPNAPKFTPIAVPTSVSTPSP